MLAFSPLTTVLLAGADGPAADLRAAGFEGLLWRGEALDGRQVVAGADAVVSAGGGMDREAAVLRARAYSIYAARPRPPRLQRRRSSQRPRKESALIRP